MVRDELIGMRLVRLRTPERAARVAVVAGDNFEVLNTGDPLAVLGRNELPQPVETVPMVDATSLAPAAPWELLAPIIPPETWAAGVTYQRSRDARLAESKVADVYDLVYDADRPELFLKDASARRTVGPGQPIRIRSDARWTVPEPELAVVLGGDGTPLAVTVGNDVSSRDIEGANPLYLPQAKIYGGACALGPALLVPVDWSVPFDIELRIRGPHDENVFSGRTSTERMHRSPGELIEFLRRDNPVPPGSVLLTGTGIVPPDEIRLESGQSVEITISGIGSLRNPVAAATMAQHRTEEATYA